MFGIIRLAAFFLKRLPPRVIGFFALVLGNLMWIFFPYRRKTIRLQMERTLGRDLSAGQIRRLVRGNYVHYANLFFEFIILSCLDLRDRRYFDEHFRIEGREEFLRALEEGKGVVAVNLHLGLWESLGALCALYLSPVTVPVKFIRNRFSQRVRERMQAHPGVTLLDSRMGRERAVAMLNALRRGEVAAVFMDQYNPSEQFAPFFGHRARTTSAAAVLVRKTRAPVFIATVAREAPLRYAMHLRRIEAPAADKAGTTQEIVAELVAVFNRAIEDAIRAHPDQWLWAHRRFKDNPEFRY